MNLRISPAAAGLLLASVLAGCGGAESTNRSTLAGDDPAAAERAKAEAALAEQQAREAEAAALGRAAANLDRP